jgi:hypothetical protein
VQKNANFRTFRESSLPLLMLGYSYPFCDDNVNVSEFIAFLALSTIKTYLKIRLNILSAFGWQHSNVIGIEWKD